MTVDTERWKIASFKTKEKLWDEFVAAAHKNGSTATNALEDLIEKYIAGEYSPTTKTAIGVEEANPTSASPSSMTK